jgi:hypothetical protein
MDDYNVSVLSEAKNEYSLRLVGILTPLILEGIKSILKEAWEVCLENDEEVKYLMTFQNFLSRVTKWNQTIIDEETARILTKSGCTYLEDLLTCVHITQLKILTSIRVSQKQKKIELDIPKLTGFVHKSYIKCARKFYSNVYLFEQKIPPLQYQKNMRECETICKDCILDVIRDNMPVEHILRSYMDECIEEEIIEEDVAKTKEEIMKEQKDGETKINEEVQAMKNLIKKEKDADVSGNTVTLVPGSVAATPATPATPAAAATPETPAAAATPATPAAAVATPETPAAAVATPETPAVAVATPEAPTVVVETPEAPTVVVETPEAPTVVVETPKTPSSPVSLAPMTSDATDEVPPVLTVETPRSLSFNDMDKVFNRDTLEEQEVAAPKTIDRLEEISKMRTAQRKAEEENEDEDDDENIKISGEDANIELDILSL